MSLLLTVTNKEEISPHMFFFKTLGLRLFIFGLIGYLVCAMLPVVIQSFILNSNWGESIINEVFQNNEQILNEIILRIGVATIFLIPFFIGYTIISSMISIWFSVMALLLVLLITIGLPIWGLYVSTEYIFKKLDYSKMVQRNYISEILTQLQRFFLFLINFLIGCAIVVFVLLPKWFRCVDCDMITLLLELLLNSPRDFMIFTMKSFTYSIFIGLVFQMVYISFSDMLYVPRPRVLTPEEYRISSRKRDILPSNSGDEMKIIEIEEFENPNKLKNQQQELLKLLEGFQK